MPLGGHPASASQAPGCKRSHTACGLCVCLFHRAPFPGFAVLQPPAPRTSSRLDSTPWCGRTPLRSVAREGRLSRLRLWLLRVVLLGASVHVCPPESPLSPRLNPRLSPR